MKEIAGILFSQKKEEIDNVISSEKEFNVDIIYDKVYGTKGCGVYKEKVKDYINEYLHLLNSVNYIKPVEIDLDRKLVTYSLNYGNLAFI
ncbi:MAG: hypothetical protein B6U88_02460 [Candidatus Aenigmarchaeota archaeon ex4484_56]|nr:MAG: hypothetical protein B6U88_02460 [Candidatus Aenigmarchaeota archaeon ex4484_56]